MNASELLAEVERLKKIAARESRYVPSRAFNKQRQFLILEVEEALYGGAAGGGKSEALLMDALKSVHVPGYAALILRRTFADLSLPGAIMSRSHEWLSGTDAHWSGVDKRWTFPSGATLTFGYLDTEADKYRYQGSELQMIGFDELTQFSEAMYSYLFTRLRRKATIPVKPRMRGATNPGGIGHKWVKARFVDDPRDRVFVPATFRDNPFINHEEYERYISRADVTTARQMRGEWIQNSGGLVYSAFDRALCIGTPPTEPMGYVLGLDFGFVDATAFVILAYCANDPNVYVLQSSSESKLTPSDVAERVRALETHYRFQKIVGDIGGLGKGYVEEARRRFQLPIEAAQKNNKRGYIDLLNGDFARGRVVLAPKTNDDLIDQLESVPWNTDRSREAEGNVCDIADALLYGWRAVNAFNFKPLIKVERTTEDIIKSETAAHWAQHEKQLRQRKRTGTDDDY